MKKKFAMIGAAGYVAPRHMKAIKDTGNELVAALDPFDSVGVLDRYFPNCKFFTEVERFDRYLDKLLRNGKGIDYMTICSPNYLHDSHCRLGLRLGADVICEKPLVVNPWNLDQLKEIESDYNKKIYTVLQLRLYPELIKLKQKIKNKKCDVKISYITPRGPWYHYSWKGIIEKSGGLPVNIGVHLFDLIIWLFGDVIDFNVLTYEKNKIYGKSKFKNADATWFLSIDKGDIPYGNEGAYRSITIDGEPLRFDNVFTDLHTEVYKDILNGGGYGIEDARPSIEFLHNIRRRYE